MSFTHKIKWLSDLSRTYGERLSSQGNGMLVAEMIGMDRRQKLTTISPQVSSEMFSSSEMFNP